MPKPTRIRWSCPAGEHPGALAPSRLRKIDIRRFCIPCSESKGVLVERLAPALEARKKKRIKKATRKKKKKLSETPVFAGINVIDEVRRIEALDVVVTAYANLERKPVAVNVRCRRQGNYTTGLAYCIQCRVVLTFPLECSYGQATTLIAHELAHIATATDERHGAAWRDMFLAILRDGYNFDAGWPIGEDEKKVSYMTAHRVYEEMMDEQHEKRST